MRIVETGSLIQTYVTLHCVYGAANIMIGCVLSAAGDTHWLARTFLIASALFLSLLWLVDRTMPGLTQEWTLATLFVFITALVWSFRFRSGAWRKVRVLREPDAAQ